MSSKKSSIVSKQEIITLGARSNTIRQASNQLLPKLGVTGAKPFPSCEWQYFLISVYIEYISVRLQNRNSWLNDKHALLF